MITIIPALDFMRGICGSYRSVEPIATLRVWTCGYGIAIDLADERKTKLVGVIGASGDGIECFAQFGLPNVLRLSGQLLSNGAVRFHCDDPIIDVLIVRDAKWVQLSVSLHGNQTAAYNFCQ